MMSKESRADEKEQIKAEKDNLEMRIAEQKQTIQKLERTLRQPPPELITAQKQALPKITLSLSPDSSFVRSNT